MLMMPTALSIQEKPTTGTNSPPIIGPWENNNIIIGQVFLYIQYKVVSKQICYILELIGYFMLGQSHHYN